MGLRAKILALFLVGFGLMTTIAVELLQRDLLPSFEAIERNVALGQLEQLVRNFDSELGHLRQANTDWANWDDVYRFLETGRVSTIAGSMSPGALRTANLDFLFLVDTHGTLRFSASLEGDQAATAKAYRPVLALVLEAMGGARRADSCGLARSERGAVMVCWQPVRRTDRSGDDVGTLISGRVLSAEMTERIRRQSGVHFEWRTVPVDAAPAPARTQDAFGPHAVQFSSTVAGLLTAQLPDVTGQPLIDLRLHFSRDVSAMGQATTWRVIEALLGVTLLNGVALLVGVQYLLVRRLRVLSKGLRTSGQDGKWQPIEHLPSGSDEIATLGRDVNRLLSVIREQVVSLESLARTDPLTGIANRRAFDEGLDRQLRVHRRDRTSLALVLIDVDFFKRYNDVYGHPAGDEVLRTLGTLLTLVARRPTDLAARIGGEEFGLILPGLDLAAALQVAERLRAMLTARAIAHGGSTVAEVVTLSIGVAMAGDEDPSALLQRADRAVYEAKKTGRNRCVLAAEGSPAS